MKILLLSTLAAVLTFPAMAFAQAGLPAIYTRAPRGQGCFAKIETSFHLPGLSGDPFDYEKNNIRVYLRLPDETVITLPAFYDGDGLWRMRHTPVTRGKYEVVAVANSGQKIDATPQPSSWNVGGKPEPGFVRIDPTNPRRFAFDNGTRYYPLGADAAWTGPGQTDYPALFSRFKAAGENWSRVWMNHWDGKNLDWPGVGTLGQLDLKAARRWDSVVESAAQNGIYFQLTLQHHGQYSSTVNSNWDENPYNVKNGGFLKSPEDFFTDPQAKALTKRKLRYIIARYGYCPQIMAWELWNEVQFTDAAQAKHWDVVAQWHAEMADFIRHQDTYNHLITTSSEAPPEVFAPGDYYQSHAYPSNLIVDLPQPRFQGKEWLVKPYFIGEYGSDHTGDRPDEWTLHSGLWAGLFGDAAGAAQYWYTDKTDANNWYFHFAAATGFLRSSGFAEHDRQSQVSPTGVAIETPQRGPLFLSPAGDWGKAPPSDFDLTRQSGIDAFAHLPRYLQGQNHRDLNPVPVTLHFKMPSAGQLEIRVVQVAKAGANLHLIVDGQSMDFPFPATAEDTTLTKTLSVPVGVGAHTVSLENTGQDWVVLRDISIPDAAMLLGGYTKTNATFAMAWFYHFKNIESAAPVGSSTGTAVISGLNAGNYAVTWWDTLTGKALKTETVKVGSDGLKLQIPAVTRDVAVWAVAVK